MPELGGLGLREMGERLVDILTAGADDQLSRVAATVCLNGVLIAAQTHDDLTPDDLHLVLTKAGHSHPRPLTRIQEAPCPPSSTRLARWCVRRRRTVLAGWLVALIALGVAFGVAGSRSTDVITIPGTEPQRALDALAMDFPQRAGPPGPWYPPPPKGQTLTSGENRSLVLAATEEAGRVPGVIGVVDPYTVEALSRDGRYGVLSVQFAERVESLSARQIEQYARIGSAAEAAGLRVERGGDPAQPEVEVGSGEVLGVGLALVVLVLTLGSLLAAGMTMLNALIGVGVGMLALMLVSHAAEFNSTTPVLALMLGLAVGIDCRCCWWASCSGWRWTTRSSWCPGCERTSCTPARPRRRSSPGSGTAPAW